MIKIVSLVWMLRQIKNLRIGGELDLFMKSAVKTSRSNYPIARSPVCLQHSTAVLCTKQSKQSNKANTTSLGILINNNNLYGYYQQKPQKPHPVCTVLVLVISNSSLFFVSFPFFLLFRFPRPTQTHTHTAPAPTQQSILSPRPYIRTLFPVILQHIT